MGRFNPAAPAVTAAIVRVSAQTITLGQRCINTFDYLWSVPATSPTLADLNAMDIAWQATLKALYLACLSPQTSLEQISYAEIHYGSTPTNVSPLGIGVVGTAGATALPLEMGTTLSRQTSLKGQHGRGRVTMPAVPNTFTTPATDGNKINAAGLAAYTALCNQLLLTLVVGLNPWTHVLSTRPIPPATTTDNALAVQSYIIDLVLGTARTRKPGRGM